MNRHERRAQGASPFAVAQQCQQWLSEGRAHHQAGRLPDAAACYQSILTQDQTHAEANHLLGLIAYRYGRLDEACRLIEQAIATDARQPTFRFNLGVVRQKQGRLEEAAEAYRQAIALNPRYVEALSNLGNTLRDLGQYAAADEQYRLALSQATIGRGSPAATLADLHNNRGVVLRELGRDSDAEAEYREALRNKVTHVEAANNLGLLLMDAGRYAEARTAFETAQAAAPGQWKSHYHLGLLTIWEGHGDDACRHLDRAARLKHDHGGTVRPGRVSRARLKHDEEQLAYLQRQGLLAPEWSTYATSLRSVRAAADATFPNDTWVSLAPEDADALHPSWNRVVYPSAAPRLDGPAVNPDLDVEEIERRWLAQQPELITVDQLLTPAALTAMRRFCWEATIWKKEYDNGYLGAFIGDGFATPLLFQIAEELRLRFPRIFGQHRLTQSWSFKHDSARRGLGMHADAAAVNVNFWVTPDEANRNPETGGLLVWDKEAPADWNFRAYNSQQNRAKIDEFLRASGANMVRVPYRCNRAVIFNSDLFHETDDVSFEDSYCTRRINITLLYGFRGK
ncbi:MAG: tetratricopeptide repeat protein [Nitrospiraceae bacterium]